ncbi:MAG TPA: tyrosine-type recombinase/integrase [Acidimicrobiia bacterium]|nr:tyrosine-type recombinase/integrase [Acidimicrobiia bacterium]
MADVIALAPKAARRRPLSSEALIAAYGAHLAGRGMRPVNVWRRPRLLERLAAWAAPRPVSQVAREEAQRWLDTQDLKLSTAAHYLEQLDAFFAWSGRPKTHSARRANDPLLWLNVESGGPLEQAARRYVRARYRQGRFTERTVFTVRYTLDGFSRAVGAVEPDDVEAADIEGWLEGMHAAAATARARLSQLRAFWRWMILQGHATKDPTLAVAGPPSPRSVPRGLKLAQVIDLLDVVPDTRALVIVLLMVQEGLRCVEVARLQVGDIDRDEHTLIVKGKGGHQRVLPISDETSEALDDYLAAEPAVGGPLIRSRTDPTRPLAAAYISTLVSSWLRNAGVKTDRRDGRSAHALRHTAATDMLRAGAHIRDVQAALGHANLSTTQRDMPWVVGDLRKAMGGRSYLTDDGSRC